MKNITKFSLGFGATLLGIFAICEARKAHENKWDAKARIAEANKDAAQANTEKKDENNKK